MRLLDNIIREIKAYLNQKQQSLPNQKFRSNKKISWPEAEKNELVLLPDLGAELGNPESSAISFLTWTEEKSLVSDGEINLIGPDIGETSDTNIPFGRIVIAEVEGFDENNAIERNREMFLAKFDISLKGFMVKSASRYMSEWWRISKEALLNHFSFEIIGNALIAEYKKLDYVKAVEIIFVTSSNEDVEELFDMGNRSLRTINAMSKMLEEMSYDCKDCEYQDICNEADELKELRHSLAET